MRKELTEKDNREDERNGKKGKERGRRGNGSSRRQKTKIKSRK